MDYIRFKHGHFIGKTNNWYRQVGYRLAPEGTDRGGLVERLLLVTFQTSSYSNF